MRRQCERFSLSLRRQKTIGRRIFDAVRFFHVISEKNEVTILKLLKIEEHIKRNIMI